MADFESGVSSYIRATVTVEVYFPVDSRGNPDVNCYQCEMFHRTSSRCGINGKICAYPQKYIGQSCPLNFEKEY
jgi:hypothetical protein